ncbi:unnamed protein product [Polarella glacialis]|uniref:Amino acid transporter transmembrane domain-containing protein n=1 Tax=Polarella glacialis TaxID=89957 RepID=A0A813FW27_POLGL|nr:unnamed protein product [Polarella glacialis]
MPQSGDSAQWLLAGETPGHGDESPCRREPSTSSPSLSGGSPPSSRDCDEMTLSAGNPFRADFVGRDMAFLPSGLQAHLDDKLGTRAGGPLCSLVLQKDEMTPHGDFVDVMERLQNEVDMAEGKVDTYSETFMSLLCALIVNPLIIMPFYTFLNGAAVSAIVWLFAAGMAHAGAQALYRCLDELQDSLAPELLANGTPVLARDYAFIAHQAFGKLGQGLAFAFYALDFWMSTISNFVIVDSMSRCWLPFLQSSAWRSARGLPVLCSAALTFVLLYVPHCVFKRTQFLGTITSLCLVLAVGLKALPRLSELRWSAAGDLGGRSFAENVLLEASSAFYAYGNVAILPKLTGSWQEADRSERDGVIKVAFGCSAVTYVIFGMLGASVMRPTPPDEVFQMRGVLGWVSQACFLLKLQLSLPLLASPPIHVLQEVLGISRSRQLRLCLNLAFLLASALLGLTAGGQIDGVMSLVGAAVTTSLVAVVPQLLQLKLCYRSMSWMSRGRSIAIASTGFVCACAGVAAARCRLNEHASF